MTPPNVTANPARYYEWLQHWMAIPDPTRDNGNIATAEPKTIGEASPTIIGPVQEVGDSVYPSGLEQPALSVVRLGRAAS